MEIEDPDSHPQLRKEIRNAFELFERDKKGYVVREEIGTIMRYLGAFPTEEELVKDVLSQLADDEDQFVKFDRFEPFMLKVMLDRLYEPDSEEVLLQAFRTLDPEGKGYMDQTAIAELLTSNESAFRDKELEEFLRIARSENGMIYYDDYVTLLQATLKLK